MAYRGDPDDALVVVFKNLPVPDPIRTLQEGRPIFDTVEHCEIRAAGTRDIKVFPATVFSRWVDDPLTGYPVKQSYAERFKHQYQQFKRQEVQTKTGTPLDYAPFLSEGKRAELKAQNIYTVEALSIIEGNELKNLGPGGRELKNKATEYIEESRAAAPNKQMQAEVEALRARNAILEEDFVAKKQRDGEEGEFAGMNLDQLREYITTNTGYPPQGNLSRKNLIRMAMDARPERVA